MKFPKHLQEGGTIGFIAPSFGCNIEPYKSCFNAAKEKWHKMGFATLDGPNAYEGCGLGISNTPEKCAAEFEEWYQREDSDVLISCGGGELMCEILEHVDFEAIAKAEPKWFMGYSDNTNITFLLATLCDTAAIYGPCAATFGMKSWHASLHDAMDLLEGKKNIITGYDLWEKEGLKSEENPFAPYNVTEKKELHYHNLPEDTNGKNLMQGRLLGGCMDSLSNLCGTQFDKVKEFNNKYEEDGIIWFMEACDLNAMDMRRALWKLSQAGWFQNAKGFLIGRPYHFGEEFFGLDQYKAVTDMLARYQVPIIMDVDLGHLPPMMPVISGSYATVDLDKEADNITITMEEK